MLITPPPQSSTDGSTTSVAAGSKDDTLHRLVLSTNHQSNDDGRPPTRNVGFNCTDPRESYVVFRDEREDKPKKGKEGIHHGHHHQTHYQHHGGSSLLSTFSTFAVDPPGSSSFTDRLNRLHESMARATESRQMLSRAHIFSCKNMVELRATTRDVLTRGIDLHHHTVLAGHHDCHSISNSSAASSEAVGGQSSSCGSRSTTGRLSTSKRQRTVQKKQACKAIKETKKTTMRRTGVAFRPCMAGMLDF